jgi:hypothetical protein
METIPSLFCIFYPVISYNHSLKQIIFYFHLSVSYITIMVGLPFSCTFDGERKNKKGVYLLLIILINEMQLLTVAYFGVLALASIIASPVTYDQVRGVPYNVSYDHRAITINGNRTLLMAGAIHYPRSTPGMWPYIMSMAKQNGLNTVQTYVFWNIHEQQRGIYDFSGRANLHQFLQDAANAGLFVNLRLGPYICAEWDYAGLPAWLNNVPNIAFRSNNDAWKSEIKRFVSDIVAYVDPFLAKNGGPIILAQIENEYSGDDMAYVDWCGSLVANDFASTKIPWIMCNGRSANSTIETCNGCNCFDGGWMDRHRHTYPNQPLMLTENWGTFQLWGQVSGVRSSEDLSGTLTMFFFVPMVHRTSRNTLI